MDCFPLLQFLSVISIRRFFCVGMTTPGLLLSAATTAAASAFNVEITEGICVITFDGLNEEQVQDGFTAVLVESSCSLERGTSR